jgi:chromosome segregation ATPase
MRSLVAKRDEELSSAKRWIEYLAKRGAILEQQVAAKSPAPEALNERVEALAAQSAASEKRAKELEGELTAARDRLALQENENRSLQTSLNLIVGESSKLSSRLADSEAAVHEANERRRTEASMLNTHLEAMLSRALAAEKWLKEAQQSMPAHGDEKRPVRRQVVDEPAALRNTLNNKLERFRNSPLIRLPTAPATQADSETELVKIQKRIQSLELQLQRELVKRTNGENARNKADADDAGLLDDDVSYIGNSERAEVRHTKSLLASILTSESAV